MTEAVSLTQKDLLCTQCGGQCRFEPARGTLGCQSCGTAHVIEIDPDADPAAEQHYHPDLPHTEQPRFTRDRVHRCGTCGGEVVFPGQSISEACPYCNGAMVMRAEDESYPPVGLIPFEITDEAAQAKAQAWVDGRWAAPGDLSTVVAQARVAGIYVPFWTFDSTEAVDYTVRYRTKSGKTTVTRTRKGATTFLFDDLLMPASPHVTPLIRDGILHDFDPARLRPFNPAYIAGFAAEMHHQSLREGLAHNAPDKRLLLRNRIKAHSGLRNIVSVSYVTDTSGMRYRRILLPVWILHYEYGGKPMKVVSCGLKGRTFGERPFSKAKLLGYGALAATVVTVFGFVWGALGIY